MPMIGQSNPRLPSEPVRGATDFTQMNFGQSQVA